MRSYQSHSNDIEKKVTNLRKEKGFTLIEVLFAIAVLAFGLLAVASMQSGAMRGSYSASRVTEAVTLAQDRLEALLGLRYTTKFTDPDLTAGHYEDPNPPGDYTITWDVVDGNPAPPNAKLITVNITWRGCRMQNPPQLTCIKPRS